MHIAVVPLPCVEKWPSGHELQLPAESPDCVPAGQGVQVAGLEPEKLETCAKPPLAEKEPAAHAPAHAAVVRPVAPVM